MITKYDKFILESIKNEILLEGAICASSNFLFRLRKIANNNINPAIAEYAARIIEFIEGEDWIDEDDIKQNYFDVTDKEDTLSFIQQNKIPEDWDEEEDMDLPYRMNRNEMKVGKILKYLCKFARIDISGKLLEQFVDMYKSTKVDTNLKFELVKGDDIIKYYSEVNYFTEYGTLGGSCMAGMGAKTFKIYSKNKDKVNLLIYIDGDKKIHGRALVWKLDESPCGAKYFMDRVYTNRSSDEIKFKNFANENGWLYKKYMNSSVETAVDFMYNGKDIKGVIKVKLDGDCKEYPYLDTLAFLNKKQTMLSNIPLKKYGYLLHSVYGELERCDDCHGTLLDRYGYGNCSCASGRDSLPS